jgi:hypothetical protein
VTRRPDSPSNRPEMAYEIRQAGGPSLARLVLDEVLSSPRDLLRGLVLGQAVGQRPRRLPPPAARPARRPPPGEGRGEDRG